MINPIIVDIDKGRNPAERIQIAQVLIWDDSCYSETGMFDLFKPFSTDVLAVDCADFDLADSANPYYLGRINFESGQLFEWEYVGTKLSEYEVIQLVGIIQNYEEPDPTDIELNRKAIKENLQRFVYDEGGAFVMVDIVENEGHFGILFDNKLAAQIELVDEWEVTSGDIADAELLQEIVGRIKSITGYPS
jgi:hypothetical protein